MMRPTVALLLLAACGSSTRSPPAAKPFSARVLVRDDCAQHAADVTVAAAGLVVVSACGHGAEGDGRDELMATRVDAQGHETPAETLDLSEGGWITNVLVTSIDKGGGLVAWTRAVDRRATAAVKPIDVQGRPAGARDDLGEGRALVLVAGPGGAAVGLFREPDALSDTAVDVRARIDVVLLDADAQSRARLTLSPGADARAPQLALAAGAHGYGAAWSENGMLIGCAFDTDGVAGPRAPIQSPAPAGARWRWPTLLITEHDAIAAAIVSPPGGGDEIWLGRGQLGVGGWAWRQIVPAQAGRSRSRLRLVQSGAALGIAYVEGGPERGLEREVLVRAASAQGAFRQVASQERVVAFDGSAGLAANPGGGFALAAAVVPAENDGSSAVGVVTVGP
jgi:hypothetical protein